MVAEDDDLALGDKERELVLCGWGQLAQLDACYFGADGGCQLLDGGPFCEEVFEGWIGIFAVVNVREGL